MVVPTLLLFSALAGAQDKPVQLQRTSKAGEKLAYSVKSYLQLETRQIGLDTFIPESLDIDYDFTAEAVASKADGIFDFRYKRPTMTITEGETVDAGPKKTIEKSNYDLMITVSPINEFLETKDLAPKKPEKDPKKTGGGGGLRYSGNARPGLQDPSQIGGGLIGQFVQEVQRLALFIGSIDTAIDFQPKLDFREVSKGDTWKRTISYSPQKLKSKGNKTVMQRLDYVYTYGGVVESAGKKVNRVTAELKMNSDLVQFIKDNFDTSQGAFPFKEITFELQAKIDYDLDLQTGHTLKAEANSEGGFKIVAIQYPEDPIVEQKLKGNTKLTLVKKS